MTEHLQNAIRRQDLANCGNYWGVYGESGEAEISEVSLTQSPSRFLGTLRLLPRLRHTRFHGGGLRDGRTWHAAEQLNLTYSQTLELLETYNSVIARRSARQMDPFTVDQWKRLHVAIQKVFNPEK